MTKVIIQGYPGSFHDEIAHRYFEDVDITTINADSFQVLGHRFKNEEDISFAVMAIENSIAGTILQNYRIIREQRFTILGEAYLRIKMNLMALEGTTMGELREIHSHPMALYQCTEFLGRYPHIKLVESEDTALSAMHIRDNQSRHIAAIGSARAASIYDLSNLAEGIEDNKTNYTRFFILSRNPTDIEEGNKASIWCRICHEQGSLLHILSVIANHNINLSKLQSYPVLGKLAEYSFHMDLEFDDYDQYLALSDILRQETLQYQELGIYQRADISAAASKGGDVTVML